MRLFEGQLIVLLIVAADQYHKTTVGNILQRRQGAFRFLTLALYLQISLLSQFGTNFVQFTHTDSTGQAIQYRRNIVQFFFRFSDLYLQDLFSGFSLAVIFVIPLGIDRR